MPRRELKNGQPVAYLEKLVSGEIKPKKT